MDFLSVIAIATMINSVALITILFRVWHQPPAVAVGDPNTLSNEDQDHHAGEAALKAMLIPVQSVPTPAPGVPDVDDASALSQPASLIEPVIDRSATVAPSHRPVAPLRRPLAPTREADVEETSAVASPNFREQGVSGSPRQPIALTERTEAASIGEQIHRSARMTRAVPTSQIAPAMPALVQRVRPRPTLSPAAPSGSDYAIAVAKMRRYLDEDRSSPSRVAARR